MSLLNPATAPCDRVQHDTVEYQRVTLSAFMRRGLAPKYWERVIKQAFRTCAIAAHHLQFASVVFMFMGTLWVSEHRAVLFGATSAVYAWHRVGHFMNLFLRALARCPVDRHVDDSVDASREGLIWHEGRMLGLCFVPAGFSV